MGNIGMWTLPLVRKHIKPLMNGRDIRTPAQPNFPGLDFLPISFRIARHRLLYPGGGSGRARSDSPVLADKIHDAPASVPLFDVRHGERRYVRPPEPATEKHCQNRPVGQPLGCHRVWRVHKRPAPALQKATAHRMLTRWP